VTSDSDKLNSLEREREREREREFLKSGDFRDGALGRLSLIDRPQEEREGGERERERGRGGRGGVGGGAKN
jgi:hypothetical protein